MAFDMNSSGSSQPLMDPYEKKSKDLYAQLNTFSRSIQVLQDDALKLGSPQDNDVFRKQITEKMTRSSNQMKKLQVDLSDFQNMTIAYDKEKERETKYQALYTDYQLWVEKFRTTTADIEQKQRMYMEVMKNRNTTDIESQRSSGMGYPTQQQALIDTDTLRLQGEVDHNAALIQERQNVFNQAETLMNDINAIANQIQTNTQKQGEVLQETDKNMTDVEMNAIEAHKEIIEARSYQKSTSKWMLWLLLAVAVIIIIIVLSVCLKK